LDEGMIYEQPWHTFRLRHLKRADNESGFGVGRVGA
jgi:hypothetical protein